MPESPWADIQLVDVSEEENEQGYAPFVEVSALGKKPKKLKVAELVRVHVQLLEDDGDPIADAEAWLHQQTGEPVGEVQRTNEAGVAAWEALLPEPYVGCFAPEGFELPFYSPVPTLPQDSTEPSVVLTPERYAAHARILDADDEPLVGAEVTLYLSEEGDPVGDPQTTDDQGEVCWDGIADGDYVLGVETETLHFGSPVELRSSGSEPSIVLAPDVEEGVVISLELIDENGSPLADVPYTIVYEGGEEPGETGDDGWIHEVLPAGLTTADLHVDDDVYELLIDELDDFDTDDKKRRVRACQARLVNLGYEPGPIDGIHGRLTSAGLRAFQERESREATGKLDDETCQLLVERHGC